MGKRTLQAAIFTASVILLAACTQPQPTPSPAATPTPLSLSEILDRAAKVTMVKYDLVMTSPQGTQTTRVWVKGNKWRIELPWWGQTGGGPLPQGGTGETRRAQGYLVNTDTNTVYTMYALSSSPPGTYGLIVEKSPLIQPHEVIGPGTATSWANVIAASDPKIVGTETIDSKEALVVEYAPAQMAGVQGQIVGKAWIWKGQPFLVRNELTIAGRTSTLEVKNISFADIPDSVFERESSFFGIEPLLK